MHRITLTVDFFCDNNDPEIAQESIKQVLSDGAEMYDCGAYNIEIVSVEETEDK